MKAVRGRVFLEIGAVLLAGALVYSSWRHGSRRHYEEIVGPPIGATNAPQASAQDKPPSPPRPAPPGGLVVRAADMSEHEKANLAKRFKENFKPALAHWAGAYKGRLPFQLDDVTLDKFHSRLGDRMYTFMVNGNTLTIQDTKESTKVLYLWSPQANDLNKLPNNTQAAPNMSTPVSREEVIRMVKADCGVEFKPGEVIIRPTGAASALSGGAFVHTMPVGSDPNNALSSKIDLVFGSDGKLVNYERDPLF